MNRKKAMNLVDRATKDTFKADVLENKELLAYLETGGDRLLSGMRKVVQKRAKEVAGIEVESWGPKKAWSGPPLWLKVKRNQRHAYQARSTRGL